MSANFSYVTTLSHDLGQLEVYQWRIGNSIRLRFDHLVGIASSPSRDFSIEIDLGDDYTVSFITASAAGVAYSPDASPRQWTKGTVSVAPPAVRAIGGHPNAVNPHLENPFTPVLLTNYMESAVTARYIYLYFPYMEMYASSSATIGVSGSLPPAEDVVFGAIQAEAGTVYGAMS